MTRVHERALPDKFYRLDTNINSANAFANVRDLQAIRNNTNILLARSCKRPIMSMICNTNATTAHNSAEDNPISIGGLYSHASNYGGQKLVSSLLIRISAWTQYVKFWARAAIESTDGGDVYLYPRIYRMSRPLEINTDYNVSYSSTSETLDSVNVPVPLSNHPYNYLLDVAIRAGCYDGDIKGATNDVVDVGDDWVIVNDDAELSESEYLNSVIYDSTKLAVEPRRVTAIKKDWAADQDKIWLSEPWNIKPDIGDEMGFRSCQKIKVFSWGLFEIGVTDWNALVGVDLE